MTKRQLKALESRLGLAIDRLTADRDKMSDDEPLREDLSNALDGLHMAHTAVSQSAGG